MSAPRVPATGSVDVSVDIENTGQREGDEVVQLYVRDLVASRVRPVKELKGFRRVTLQPGERRTLTFKLTPAELGFYNQEMRYFVEPGTFKVMLGRSSADPEMLEAAFEVTAR